jgi:3-deoxy-manno-octulosonate cytidylyltransferase (CMP-KDO synthetase)
MENVGIIPARAMSTRLPGKPLKLLDQEPLVLRMWRKLSTLVKFEVFVATDDDAIECLCRDNKVPVLFVESASETFFDCAYKAVQVLKSQPNVSIQQDVRVLIVPCTLPFISKELVDPLFSKELTNYDCLTPVLPILEFDDFTDINVVKVVLTDDNRPKYYSRAPLPYSYSGYETISSGSLKLERNAYGFRDLSVSLIRCASLKKVCESPRQRFEQIEGVEQLRFVTSPISHLAVMVNEETDPFGLEITTSDSLKMAAEVLEQRKVAQKQ